MSDYSFFLLFHSFFAFLKELIDYISFNSPSTIVQILDTKRAILADPLKTLSALGIVKYDGCCSV